MVALLCTGTGMAFVVPARSQHIVGSLPLAKAGVGSAVNDVTREVGGALGIAVAGSIVATVYRARVVRSTRIPVESAREVASESIGQAVGVAHRRALAGLHRPGRRSTRSSPPPARRSTTARASPSV